MAFNASYNEFKKGDIRGIRRNIACLSWFSYKNEPNPISFKFKGDDDEIISVKNIYVLSTEDKNYSSIFFREYTA